MKRKTNRNLPLDADDDEFQVVSFLNASCPQIDISKIFLWPRIHHWSWVEVIFKLPFSIAICFSPTNNEHTRLVNYAVQLIDYN